ncbi:rCG62387 [Rattus norvegicus]|uniref:RCG62387 n=1 Tax=Rattus norvegicus TaxID=10116 RepID=A6HAR5_RAT|nr:rCG62387 [Rattus norvegicus]
MDQLPLSSAEIILFNIVVKSTRVLTLQIRNLRLGELTGPHYGLELKCPPRLHVLKCSCVQKWEMIRFGWFWPHLGNITPLRGLHLS